MDGKKDETDEANLSYLFFPEKNEKNPNKRRILPYIDVAFAQIAQCFEKRNFAVV